MSTKKLQIVNRVITTDETLTLSGIAADAKAVGDLFSTIQAITTDELNEIFTSLIAVTVLDEVKLNTSLL